MKKKLLILLVSCFSIPLFSQISITHTNMPVSGDTCRYTNAALSSVGDYTTTGANYVWDFSTLDSTSQTLREFKSITNTPYSFFGFLFASTAYGEKTLDTVPIPTIPIPGIPSISLTDIYTFYSKSPISLPTKFLAEGLGVKINGIPLPNTFTNEDELYFFPLNYTDRDSSTFRFSTLTTTLIPFQYIKQGYRITEVDGWGSITTPYGTEQCLRVVTTQYSIDTFKVFNLPFLGTQSFGFPNYVRSYQWLSLGEKIPYLEVSGNLIAGNFTPNQAKYRDVIRSFVGIKEEIAPLALSVFPNPANTELSVIIPQNIHDVIAEITDLQGKIILTKTLAQNSNFVNQHLIDVSNIAKGVYLLKLSTGTSKQTLKISVQ